VPTCRFTLEANHEDLASHEVDLSGMDLVLEIAADTWPTAASIEQVVFDATGVRCRVQHAEVLK
jgi:hypothetical protein